MCESYNRINSFSQRLMMRESLCLNIVNSCLQNSSEALKEEDEETCFQVFSQSPYLNHPRPIYTNNRQQTLSSKEFLFSVHIQLLPSVIPHALSKYFTQKPNFSMCLRMLSRKRKKKYHQVKVLIHSPFSKLSYQQHSPPHARRTLDSKREKETLSNRWLDGNVSENHLMKHIFA